MFGCDGKKINRDGLFSLVRLVQIMAQIIVQAPSSVAVCRWQPLLKLFHSRISAYDLLLDLVF